MTPWIRRMLIVVQGLVGLTAVAGGVTLTLGSLLHSSMGVLVPPSDYLAGSPFSTYLIPGVLLAVVVGGTQIVALVLVGRRMPSATIATVVAGMGLNIWVFVELVFIPFSFLQVLYFVAALAEIGFVLLSLGLFAFMTRTSIRPEPHDNYAVSHNAVTPSR